MVFKEGTFHGEVPEHFDGPHPALLETAVADALAAAGTIDPSDVAVTCENGTVFLTGRVGSLEEIERAVAIAASVAGVRAVESKLSAG
ncbi:BON domain-containing protein [Mycoplana rhizolycopersici]|jgi:osmotically-inducible protein OsmY|uniref:BON domain-containing protein n=1 Tax=Mycoplana rhizolycopersici TaxID=2746702 RepID=A0ABX2Q7F5_9HYPH|nr:BON domain-containing protein [Rhizobium rhizolycopersici]NVP53650.1 BON domain-containing protein [Rhizobium rhizolycopersici]